MFRRLRNLWRLSDNDVVFRFERDKVSSTRKMMIDIIPPKKLATITSEDPIEELLKESKEYETRQ